MQSVKVPEADIKALSALGYRVSISDRYEEDITTLLKGFSAPSKKESKGAAADYKARLHHQNPQPKFSSAWKSDSPFPNSMITAFS